MAKNQRNRFELKTYTNKSGSKSWRISGYKPNGDRVRLNFTKLESAQACRLALENEAAGFEASFKIQSTRLSSDEIRIAEAAIERLGRQAPLLLQAVDEFMKNHDSTHTMMCVEDGFKQFMEEKEADGLRKATINDYRSRIGMLVSNCSGLRIHEITSEHVRNLIKRKQVSAVTQNGVRRCLYTFFEWAVERGFCERNPVKITKKSKVDTKLPGILKLDEAKDLLAAAVSYQNGILVPHISLGLFAGLRHAELTRLTWDDVDLEHNIVQVTGKAAKLRQNRTVDISPNLREWLVLYRDRPIHRADLRTALGHVRRLAGFKGTRTTKKDKNLKPWPKNATRHSSLSYYFGKHRDEGRTAAFAGNSPDVFHRNYRNLVSPQSVEVYWNLTPENVSVPTEQIQKSGQPQD